MQIAIYSRKSKFTNKGDSIENQIQLCKEYAFKHFKCDETNIEIYEDEGFSGGNTDRPNFKRLMNDIKSKKINTLICYRLDRISRNVGDFSSTIEALEKFNVNFVSIREQFDTSTPMGRAMMYISSVFAQLERETIAERIRDNMLLLAKSGRWLGGTTPTGFASEPVTYTDDNGKLQNAFKLTVVDNEISTVNLIFEKYLKFQSLTKVEEYLLNNNYTTKNNNIFSRFAIKNILTNPVYVIADEALYNYFINNEYEVFSNLNDFNGINGIMAYNKTKQEKNVSNKIRNNNEWIISVGKHKGIIKSDDWILIQNLINENKSKSYRKSRTNTSLLSGIIKCKNCGSYMRAKNGRKDKDGNQLFYYLCELKDKSRKQKCDISNVKGNYLDELILSELKKMSSNISIFTNKINNIDLSLKNKTDENSSKLNFFQLELDEKSTTINNLIKTLGKGQSEEIEKYILNEIDVLHKEKTILQNKINDLKENLLNTEKESKNLEIVKSTLSIFNTSFEEMDIVNQRLFLKSIIKEVTWNGSTAEISLFGVINTELFPPCEDRK